MPVTTLNRTVEEYQAELREQRDWIDAREAAGVIGCQIEHVWRLGREGKIERRKGRKYVRFLRSSVMAHATSGEPTPVTIDVRRPRPRPRLRAAR